MSSNICPMLTLAMSGTGTMFCEYERCAWYDSRHERCAACHWPKVSALDLISEAAINAPIKELTNEVQQP